MPHLALHPLGLVFQTSSCGLIPAVMKPWVFDQVATSSFLTLKKQQTDFTSASWCSCWPSWRDHGKQSIPVGTRHMKRLASAQRASQSHPKAPGRVLPNWPRGLQKIHSLMNQFGGSLSLSPWASSQPLWLGKTFSGICSGREQDSSIWTRVPDFDGYSAICFHVP